MTTIKHIFPLIVCVGLLLFGASCSSSRKVVEQQGVQPGVELPQPAQQTVVAQGWTSFSAPVSVNLAEPVRFGLSGRASMVRGESIHISMRIFGMEVGVMHANQDSVWVADKFHKYLCAVPTKSLTESVNLSFADLQDMMLGITPNVDTPIEHFEYQSKSGKSIGVDFGNFIETPAGNAASDIEINGDAGKLKLAASLHWSLDNAKWNEPVDDSWTPPTSYKRIDAASLVKSLKM